MAKPKKSKKGTSEGVLANNKKARHDYAVMETYEAGIELTGTEVKSCRGAKITILDGYAQVDNGQIWLHNVHIAHYDHGNMFNHKEKRQRRLLMHKSEILKISNQTKESGLTLIPLKVYLKRGLVKVLIGVCKGKNVYDKRHSLREKQDNMDANRAMKAMK